MSFEALTHLLRRIIAWLFWPALAVVIWGELKPSTSNPEVIIWDKILHFTAYFGLALIATLALRANQRKWLVAIVLIVFGGLMEIVQGFVGRDMDIFDELANTVGVVTGVLVGWALVALHEKLVARQSRS